MQIRICADVTCEWRNAERERRRWQAGWTRERRRGQERRRMEDGERAREREVSAILHGPQRGHCPRRPSEDARIKAATWSPPPLITYSLLSPPLKCCQFTSLLSFSAELCFCYIKIQ